MSTQRLAFVTGASRGIGRAIAIRLLEDGYFVACGYNHHQKDALDLEKKYSNAFSVQVDIRSRASVKASVQMVQKKFAASIDIIVNNAGIADEKSFEKITDADWDRMLETNLRGAFIVSQETLSTMRKRRWGRIVNIVSIGGQWGGMRQVHYAAAKAGLINFTHSLAKLYSSEGVTANAVAPGLVATDMTREELFSPEGKEKVARIPIGRLTTLEEIAAAVAFLVSDEAASVTGQTLNVNGGMLFS